MYAKNKESFPDVVSQTHKSNDVQNFEQTREILKFTGCEPVLVRGDSY
jgi:hypothetical protein